MNAPFFLSGVVLVLLALYVELRNDCRREEEARADLGRRMQALAREGARLLEQDRKMGVRHELPKERRAW